MEIPGGSPCTAPPRPRFRHISRLDLMYDQNQFPVLRFRVIYTTGLIDFFLCNLTVIIICYFGRLLGLPLRAVVVVHRVSQQGHHIK